MSIIPSDDIPVILLAAGASSRMLGRDKLLEIIDGNTLLSRQISAARAATKGQVLVSLPPAPHARYAQIPECGVKTVEVPDAHDGMSASIRAAISALPKDVPAAMIVLADLPDLTTDDLKTVLAAVNCKGPSLIWRGASETGKPGHPIVFRRALFADLCAQQGDKGGAGVILAQADKVVLVPLPKGHAVRDLDTPEDWATWRQERTQTKNQKAES